MRTRSVAPSWAAGWLRDLRVAAGLTQEQLAHHTGLAVRSIRDLERGVVKRPRLGSLELIAGALDLSPEASDKLQHAFRGPHPTRAPLSATEAVGRAHVQRTPAELPRDIFRFIGRDDETQRIGELLHASSGAGPPVIVVYGAGGFGKTTLAIHVAHEHAASYADGQVFIALAGPRDDHLSTERAQLEILWALGVPEHDLPRSAAARTRLLRTLTSDTAILFALDDARDAAHVEDLIPSGSANAVIITSRSPLHELDLSGRIQLATLSRGESVALLSASSSRTDEPAACSRLADLCGDLPLALRVAAARLAARPDWTATDLVVRLEEEHTRLSFLSYGVLGVRACLGVSYQALADSDAPLDQLACEVLARLSRLPAHDFAVETVLTVLDLPAAEVEGAVERLVDVQLLQSRSPDRVSFHNLTLLFARELPVGPTADADVVRLGATMAAKVTEVAAIFGKEHGELATLSWLRDWPRSRRETFTWFRDEVANIADYVQQRASATPQEYEICRFLVQDTWVLLEHGRLSDTRDQAVAALLAAADRYDDPLTQVWCERQLGFAYGNVGDVEVARAHLARAAAYLARLPEDPVAQARGNAWVLSLQGILDGMAGDLDAAEDHLREALRVMSGLRLEHQRQCLQNLAFALLEAGRPVEALRYNLRLLNIDHVVDVNSDMVATLGVAETLAAMGRPHDALRYARMALELAERARVPRRVYEVLVVIATESYHAGLADQAREAAQRAAAVVAAQAPAAQWSTSRQRAQITAAATRD